MMNFLLFLWLLLGIVLAFGVIVVLLAGLVSTHRHKEPKRRGRARAKGGTEAKAPVVPPVTRQVTPPVSAPATPPHEPVGERTPQSPPDPSTAPPAGETHAIPVHTSGRTFVDVWLDDEEGEQPK